jgi:hypothetical protein
MRDTSYKRDSLKEIVVLGVLSLVSLIFLSAIISAVPTGPSFVNVTSNVTKAATAASMINISGGYIATLSMNMSVQDPKWKAFLGNISSSFTLSDAVGSTIYNWASASNTGRVYATRNSSITNWATINCSNRTTIENENQAMILNSSTAPSDNITQTFNMTPGNTQFFVGSVSITANSCPTLLTYVNNATQTSTTFFQEVPLFTSPGNLIYETPIQNPAPVGYNGQNWNFQMLVPENGTVGFNSATAYYLYVELGT